MDRLIDLKEIIEIPNTEVYSLARRRGSIGMDFSFSVPALIEGCEPGSIVTFKGKEFLVTSRERSAGGEEGFGTGIAGVSKIGELVKACPTKSLSYMSMNEDEIFEFDLACKGDYKNLDYLPLIKKCDPRTGIGGWNSGDVIADLLQRAQLDVICNVYSYWVKQVQASNTSSYFETVLSLVSMLRPLVYSDEERIYIMERPQPSVSAGIRGIRRMTQREAYNIESKAKYFSVRGGYGEWRREKSEIPAVPERETQIVSVTQQDKPLLCTVNMTGETETIKKNYGQNPGSFTIPTEERSSGTGTFQYSFWLKEEMREVYTTTEVWRLDPFGGFKALLSRHTVGYNATVQRNVLDTLESYEYDFLTEEYDRPRLRAKHTVTGRYRWQVISSPAWGMTRMYAGKVDEVSEGYAYGPNGTMIEEVLTRSTDVVKLASGSEWTELDVADQYYVTEGSSAMDTDRMVVEERVTTYKQLTFDLYQKATTIRKLGPYARKVGEENYKTGTETIRGRVPRHPRTYRKMQVYCDNIPDEAISERQEAPTLVISNPNIIDWSDAEYIFGRLKEMAAQANVVERALVIPRDIEIEIGWEVDLNSQSLPGAVFPEGAAPNYHYVVAWQKTKNAGQPACETTITIEGR